MSQPFLVLQNYNLDKENLQLLALHVATAARSLYKQLEYSDQTKLETQILKDITRTVGALKPLIGWLDRAPFRGNCWFVVFNEPIVMRQRVLGYRPL